MGFQRLGAVERDWLKPLQGGRRRGCPSRNQEGIGLGFVGEVGAEQNEHLGCRLTEFISAYDPKQTPLASSFSPF